MSDFRNTLNEAAYRRKAEMALQKNMALLRQTVTTETIVSGGSVYFPVIAKAADLQARAGDGELAFNNAVHTRVQVSLTFKGLKDQLLAEDLQESQTDAVDASVKSLVASKNRSFDGAITTALDATTTVPTALSAALTNANVRTFLTQLRAAHVPNDGQIYWLLTPNAWGQMMGFEEVTSFDYSERKLLTDAPDSFRYMGCTFILHPELPGVGTSSAKMFLYHKSCIGHAAPPKMEQVTVTPEEENRRWIPAVSLYHGAAIIQNAGVIEIGYDDTVAQAA